MATGERKVIREGQVEHFISTYICHALVDDSQEASRTINQLLLSLYCEDTFFPDQLIPHLPACLSTLAFIVVSTSQRYLREQTYKSFMLRRLQCLV